MGQRLSLPARLCSSSAMPSGSNTDSDRERESSEGGNTPVRSGLVRAHSSGPANAPQSFFNRSEPRPRAASLVFGRRSRKSGRNKEKEESTSQTQEQSSQLQQQESQEPQPGPSGIQSTSSGKKGKSRGQQNWASKLNCRKMKVGSGKTVTEASDIPQPSVTCEACVCTGYRRTAEHHLGAGVVFQAAPYRQELPEVDSLPPRDPDDIAAEEAARAARQARRSSCPSSLGSQVSLAMGAAESVGSLEQEEGEIVGRDPVIDLSRFRPEDFPTEDCDELARLERAREMREGVEPPPGFSQLSSLRRQLNQLGPDLLALDGLAAALFHSHVGTPPSGEGPLHMPSLPAILHHALPELMPPERVWTGTSMCFTAHRDVPYTKVHTQVDYIHCLVPDLHRITACSFYWGKMDRYEAERLLEGRPEGSFLLRDSAQDEYLFSVSFRKYGRSLHARIEQWNHRFSFDSHDPGVFASGTVCGLIEHYKDPACCMFFEPMLTLPLPRTNPFSLQHLSRAVVCSRITYDGVTQLHIPKPLKAYLKEYHYKQRVRVRRYDNEN